MRLPASVEEALGALEADAVARRFLPDALLAAYVSNRTAELEVGKEWDTAELCRRYVEVC